MESAQEDGSGPTQEDASGPAQVDGSEPTQEDASEPTQEDASEPTQEDASEPTQEDASEPTQEDASEPTQENRSGPTQEDASEPTQEDASGPTQENGSEPTQEDASEPAQENRSGPTQEDASEPTQEDASEPTQENGSGPTQEDESGPTQEDGLRPARSCVGWRRLAALPWGWVGAALIPVAFLAVFFGYPVVALVGRGFVSDAGATLAPMLAVLGAPRTWRIVGQTLAQAAAGTVGSVLLGLPGAYVLYRCRFPGRRVVRALVAVPFVLPSVVVGVAFSSLFGVGGALERLGWHDSFAAVVPALIFFNFSVVVRTVGALWTRLDARAQDAARTLGAGPVRVFATVTLPALGPAIASAAALVFLFCASAFGVVLILGGLGYGTIETEIWYQTTQLLDLPVAAALSILQLLIVGASLMLANAARARQERALRLRPNTADQPLRPADWPAVAVTALVLIGLLAPLISLASRSFVTASGLGWDNYARLLLPSAGSGVSAWQAMGNSLVTALFAAGLALGLGVLVCYVLSRRPASGAGRRALGLVDAVFMLPLGVSAVTVGFGFLIALNRPPLDLRTSWVLVPIAQAMVALPLVVRTVLPTWRAIDPRLRQAAATLGASPGRVLFSIDAPQLARGLGLATGFAFATSLGEFGATTFLARPDRPTLPVAIVRLLGRPGVENVGTAMAAAVVLALLTGAVMALAEAFGPKEVGSW